MSKKVLKKKSFADLINLREKVDIVKDSETIFSLVELNADDFQTAFQMVFNFFVENKPMENLQNEMLPFLMRKMLVSDIYEINGLSDNDVINTIQGSGYTIVSQVNSAIESLVMKKIYAQINELNKKAKEIEEMTREVEQKEGE